MDSIAAALEDLRLQDKPNIAATARRHEIDRSVLSRRYREVSTSLQVKHQNQCLLSPPQERRLVKYINRITEIGLPPTPSMVRNFAHSICQKEPGKGWSSRFCKRWSHVLDSRYLTAIDISRQKADSKRSYAFYFDLLDQKIRQYEVQARNIYNMDEKGFLIGRLTKARRIFTKAAYQQGQILGPNQDGNRVWITCVATICADGTWLPPALIYNSEKAGLVDSWVQDFDGNSHNCYFAASPTGWTNDKLGMSWLNKIFEPASKAKALRDWRVLFVDGHGSHINMEFLDYCISHRILVACYPPHSTHRLQPLDVSLFSPLAIYYSQELDHFIHQSQGFCRLSNRDFFRLFWPAFNKAFIEKNINSGFKKTGIHPFNPEVILGAFKRTAKALEERPPSQESSNNSVLSASDWRKIRSIVYEVFEHVSEQADKKKLLTLSNTLIDITTQNALLKAENNNFKDALVHEKKRRKRGKQLFEELRAQQGGSAVFFSPNKIQAAKELQTQRDEAKVAAEASKAERATQKKVQQQAKQVKAREQQLYRLQAKLAKQEALAQKALEKEHQKETKHSAQQLQETLQALVKKQKRRRPQSIHLPPPPLQQEEVLVTEPSNSKIEGRARNRRKPAYLADFVLD